MTDTTTIEDLVLSLFESRIQLETEASKTKKKLKELRTENKSLKRKLRQIKATTEFTLRKDKEETRKRYMRIVSDLRSLLEGAIVSASYNRLEILKANEKHNLELEPFAHPGRKELEGIDRRLTRYR